MIDVRNRRRLRPHLHAIHIETLNPRLPQHPVRMPVPLQPRRPRIIHQPAPDALVVRPVAVPVDIAHRPIIDHRPARVLVPMLHHIDLRPVRRRIIPRIINRRRLYPKRRPHPVPRSKPHPRLPIPVSIIELPARPHKPRLVNAALRVSRNRHRPAPHTHRRRHILRIAPRPRRDAPLRRIQRSPIKLIAPIQRPAIPRRLRAQRRHRRSKHPGQTSQPGETNNHREEKRTHPAELHHKPAARNSGGGGQ